MRALAPLLSVCLAAACSDAPGGAPSAAPAATSAPAPAASVPSRPAPDDLALEALAEVHKCPPEKGRGPCRALELVKTCKPWTGLSQSGDGRWLGHAYEVEGGKTTELLAVVRSRTVPLVEVQPGELNAKLGILTIPKSDKNVAPAEKALRAYERFDVPARGNPTTDWVKSLSDFTDLAAMRTTNGKVLVLGDEHAQLCEGPNQRLVLVRPAGPGKKKGDGLYAELWPVVW